MYGMSYIVRGFPCRQSLAKTAIFNDTINLHNHNIVNIKCKSLTNEVWLNEFLIGIELFESRRNVHGGLDGLGI